MKLLRIINPGPMVTVQDDGRRGYQKHGLAQGGAADRHAFRWANKLLDNAPAAACLELVFGGFEAEALNRLSVSLTGAAKEVLVNGTPTSTWRTLTLNPGDCLQVPPPAYGRFSYLAVAGGVHSKELFSSRSVIVREQIEGLQALAAGTIIEGGLTQTVPPRSVPAEYVRHYRSPVLCRLVPGYQYEEFTLEDRERFFSGRYQVSNQSDRMGFRLEGLPLQSPPPGIVSEGIAMGAVQVPGDGDPIVLLNDRQTIGGYPKLGVVSSQDCSRLAQALPGQDVQFALAELPVLQAEWQVFEHFFRTSRWHDNGDGLKPD